ncbi:MAG: GAF domain-containing protein [Anaerolineaceae bacterium]|nr:GAF domain-containing protein [Anaerolineaceae bacterium]
MAILSRVLNVTRWPLWVKISLGLVVAVIIPLIIGGFIIQSGFVSYSLNTEKDILDQAGKQQLKDLTAVLQKAESNLTTLATSEELSSQFIQSLESTGVNFQDARGISLDMQRELLQIGNFQAIQLVNLKGLIVAQATTKQLLTKRGFDSQSAAFIAAQNGAQSSIIKTVSVSNDPNLLIEYTYAISNEENQIIGYLVATLDNAVVLQYLDVGENIDSYLVTAGQNPLVIKRQGVVKGSTLADSVAVKRAFTGQTATTTYVAGSLQNNVEILGSYGSIANPAATNQTLFALVSELPTSAIPNPVLEYLGGSRLFVAGVGLVIVIFLLAVLGNQMITPPINNLRQAMQAVVDGDFNHDVVTGDRYDEIGQLNATFIDMRAHVRGLIDELEGRIASRTRDISATQEVGRFAASQRNLQTLMEQIVELITEKFPDIYHAQIFLLDADREYAVLRASTGEPGKIMLARGHKLMVGSVSVIGQVTGQGEFVVARDTGTSQVHQRNELLPLTRAELAIPLKVGDVTIGALDVQSRVRDAFGKDEITILQTMADQVAVAIENARLYQDSVRRLEEIERINRNSTLKAWQEYLNAQRERELSSEAGIISGTDLSAIRKQAVQQNRIVVGAVTANQTVPIAVPVQLRGQILGAVEWEIPAADLSENKLQLAQELANRLATSLDNARLFQESQRAAERERVVNNIAARLTPQTEIGDILQTAVREVGQALRSPQVSIRLHRTNGSGSNGNGSTHN